MAPCGLLSTGLSLLTKSASLFSCSGSLSRYSRVQPVVCFSPVKYLTTEASGPPKRPLSGYMRYVMQQRPLIVRQNQEIKPMDVIRKIAQQWRMLSPDQKRPFEEASFQAREQFKVDLQRYQAQLSPAQLQQQSQEKRQRMAKRKAIRKKRELTSLGKPKRSRSAVNIFISEHFEEARGVDTKTKLRNLMEDWRNLLSHQKKVYIQLAEDDKIRYKNEMKSWEDHMVDIGREDLIREQTLSSRKKRAIKTTAAKKTAKKNKSKAVKKAGAGKNTTATARKTTKSSSTKTLSKHSKKT